MYRNIENFSIVYSSKLIQIRILVGISSFINGELLLFLSLTDRHLIEIEVTGPFDEKTNLNFKCTTIRSNPALVGHVTGNATYASFFNSLLGNS